MRIGKLSPEELGRAVFGNVQKNNRAEVLLAAALGEDSAVLDLQGELCVLSTDPITGASAGLGRLAVIVACNDVATSGAEPVGVLLTILAPPEATLEDISQVVTEANQAAEELGVQIIGGHTEVTQAVNQMVLSTTAIGRVPATSLLTSGSARAGCSLILVRNAGLEGTAIIAHDYEEQLWAFLTPEEIETAKAMSAELSVVRACRLAASKGAVAMHDVTEGGVLGAAYEMAQAANLGLELAEDIPVHPVTVKICTHFLLDPLRLISSGSLLIAAPAPAPIIEALKQEEIEAAVIGMFTDSNTEISQRGCLISPPESDELWKFKAQVRP